MGIACPAPNESSIRGSKKIGSEGSLEMPGIEDYEMVQAVSAYGSDQAFGVRILPGTLGSREHLFNIQGRDPQPNSVAVDAIPVANDIWGARSH